MATLLRLLEAKEALLHEIQKMNAIAAQLVDIFTRYFKLSIFRQAREMSILHFFNNNTRGLFFT